MDVKRLEQSIVAATIITLAGCGATVWGQTARVSDAPFKYPQAKKVDVVDDCHGTKVADPYRWMENLDSPEIKAWIEAENKITFGYLEAIPQREQIRKRLTRLWDYEKYGTPARHGGRYFFSKNDGLQNQSVLYVAESLDATPRVLLDPNKLSEDGTVALAGGAISDDGKLFAYGLADAGSDWVEYRVRDIDTGKDLPDHIKWIKFSGVSWTKDGSGFYYSRFDEPQDGKLESVNYYNKLYFHRLGTDQAGDKLVYHRPDEKEWGFSGDVTDDGRYLIISISKGTERKNRVYYMDLEGGDRRIVELLDDFDAQYSFIDNDGPLFWFNTDLAAPRGRVIAIYTRRPERENWKEIIPQAQETLQGVNVLNDTFVASYLKDAYSQVKLFDLSGKHVRDVEFPGIGSAGGFGGKRDETETFYAFTSFGVPTTVYRYDMQTGRSTICKQPQIDFDPDSFVTKQVFYTSRDGTRVPMFITHEKDLKLDGSNPAYLYGYGGFNVSLSPWFSISNVVWMEMGGVYAMPNIRGGGEYGKAWHDAGRLKNKQNCFDDFIAAAEWLIENKYTRPDKLAIGGASNGGLLVGACMTQRPELFGACLPDVGVMDMLRFHKFTIGWAWTSDYGSPDDPQMFEVLRAYSPLHNLKPGTAYPATLITTADHDDRVVPSHSFKFAAALQAAHAGDKPTLIRIETRAGHGAGKPTAKIIEEIADKWAFLVRTLGVQPLGK
ncbi:MAG: prolyl oligopeptidase family serine peptidase [Planctomycetes bacterium]|nr:prolyl oligopeptidase family serine peptidase [Planctomycetota bacterium]